MLRALISSSSRIRDSLVRTLGLPKVEDTPLATIYRKEKWIFLFLHTPLSPDMIEWIDSSYLPDRLYFPLFGYSIDMMHEVGDVIVPNVFLPYDASLSKKEITKDHRDPLVQGARFLTTLPEQKDYYVEDYGLSV